MTPGQHPYTVDRSAAVQLRHKVKAMNVFVKFPAVPMGYTVLVPRYGGTNAGLFDK